MLPEEKDAQKEEHKAKIEEHGAQMEGQDVQELVQAEQQLQKSVASPQTFKKKITEFQEPTPQLKLGSYYKFIEGGRLIPEKFTIPLLHELEIERGCTHKWMHIAKSKNVEDVGLMEERLIEMGKELGDVRLRESMVKDKLQTM